MNRPTIATILETGEYGTREMTDEEIAEFEELKANAPIVDLPRAPWA